MGSAEIFFVKQNGDNSRYFAFSAEPEKSCTPSTLDFSEPAEKTTISSNSRRFIGEGDPKRNFCTFGEKEQTSKRQTNEKKSLFGQKRDLQRVRALARTCQETSKSHQNSDFLGLGTPRDNVYTWGKEQCATHLPEGFTLMPLAMICLRRDIVFDSDFALQ